RSPGTTTNNRAVKSARRLLCYLNAVCTQDGEWSKLRWKGFTRQGIPRIVSGSGYRNERWNLAHRSLVRAAIIQAAGRGRGLLSEGCEVLILSNEECGFPLADQSRVESVTDAAMAVLDALTTVAGKLYQSGTCR
ncbi:MAG: hypothetical protein O3B68_14705, partial [Planctomycetota bacterium]|nr:hypothetical protein [Planctomycetota bacterium]